MTADYTDDIAYFIAFCVELYKNAHAMTGAEVVDIFNDHNMLEYLSNNYEILHTQGPEWILAELEDFLHEDNK